MNTVFMFLSNFRLNFFIVLIFLYIGELQASTISTIRASNFYSKAIDKYKAGNCSKALSDLREAENNLKGKSNRDLEYLKIICQYKTEDFQSAYDNVLSYFEAPKWKNNNQYFVNVDDLETIDKIDYEVQLTSVFIELEKWAETQKNANPLELASKIGYNLNEQLRAYEPSGSSRTFEINENLNNTVVFETKCSLEYREVPKQDSSIDTIVLVLKVGCYSSVNTRNGMGRCDILAGEYNYRIKGKISVSSNGPSVSFSPNLKSYPEWKRCRDHFNLEDSQKRSLAEKVDNNTRKKLLETYLNRFDLSDYYFSKSERLAYEKISSGNKNSSFLSSFKAGFSINTYSGYF